MQELWNWIGNLTQAQATFLGWLVGLGTLLVGALVVAHQNRKRDDRLRAEERRSVATALRAELAGCRDALLRNSEQLEAPKARHFLLVDLAHAIQVWPHMTPKLGLFDQATIERVSNAYLAIEQYCEMLLLKGGRLISPERIAVLAGEAEASEPREAREAREVGETRSSDRRLIFLPADKAPPVIQIHNAVSEAIESAIVQLDISLRKRWWRPWR